MLMPNMIGFGLGFHFSLVFRGLEFGDTAEASAPGLGLEGTQFSGLGLEVTQFFLQTDLIPKFGGPNPLKFLRTDDTFFADVKAIHPPAAVFGTSPPAGGEIIPGHNVFLRVASSQTQAGPPQSSTGTPLPQLLRFPKIGDTGFEVLELQQALTDRGFTTKTEGTWGDETEQKIRAFTQTEHHSPVAFLIERIWQALGLPMREPGVPGFPGPAGLIVGG